MTSFPDPSKSRALTVYAPEERPWAQAKKRRLQEIQDVSTISFKVQLTDSRLLRAPLSRECILAGDYPRPMIGPGLPQPYQGTRDVLLRTISGTVHSTMDRLDYNGLPPFIKMLHQLRDGSSFLETEMDARGEEPGTTCVGMSHALLKQLKDKHGIEGSIGVLRNPTHPSFCHAAVIVECRDGYVLLDPNSNPSQRIFPVSFEQTTKFGSLSFSGGAPGSLTPIAMTLTNDKGEGETFQYCTNIANGDDLVMKHFMMEAPFEGASPAFPVSSYYPNGKGCKTVWVSPLQSKITLKNMTLPNTDPGRTVEISFQEIQEGLLRSRLESLYNAGQPTFHIPLEELHEQLTRFVSNAELINQIFRDVRLRDC